MSVEPLMSILAARFDKHYSMDLDWNAFGRGSKLNTAISGNLAEDIFQP